jgi:hypothetical protein
VNRTYIRLAERTKPVREERQQGFRDPFAVRTFGEIADILAQRGDVLTTVRVRQVCRIAERKLAEALKEVA